MAEVITVCDCGQLPSLPRNQQLDAYDRKQWGATLSDADLDAMRAKFVAAELDEGNWPEACDACGAEPGEECRPMCIGQALANDEAHVFSAEQDAVYAHLSRAHCSCGWQSGGYSKIAEHFWQRHLTEAGAAPQ